MNIKKIIHREFFITIVLILIIVLFLKNINFFKKMYFSAILILTKDLQIKSIIIVQMTR